MSNSSTIRNGQWLVWNTGTNEERDYGVVVVVSGAAASVRWAVAEETYWDDLEVLSANTVNAANSMEASRLYRAWQQEGAS